ncbi:hypothetical protein [Streptomyces sp. NBC_00038]|uniref:hypothetical protein n=1 Tax=Streptomyces sp. NBC_00038 TaxID=2903615 RepID=UPI002B1E678A|nr:hypothetical protein [Streptomyces sp. NBC_00038]
MVLDTDGVITDSARVHATAWKTAFDAYLEERRPDGPADQGPFDVEDDHLRFVDGKSRLDGAASFLRLPARPRTPRHAGAPDLFDTLVDGGEAARRTCPANPTRPSYWRRPAVPGSPPPSPPLWKMMPWPELRPGGVAASDWSSVQTGPTPPGTRAALLNHGADLVVDDLAELLDGEN